MPRPQVVNRWAVFAVGIASQIVFSATFLGLPAASVILQDSMNLSVAGLALILGGASLAVVLVETPWGVAADHFGERRVLLLGVTGTVCALVCVAIASSVPHPSVWMLAVLLFVAAAAGGAVTGPSGSAILGWFSTQRHGTLLSLRVAAVPVGGALGTLLYSWALSELGLWTTFLIFAAACAACALLIWVFVFDPPQPMAADATPDQSPVASALRMTGVWRVATSGLLLDIAQFLILTFAAAILADQHGYPPGAGVLAVAIMQFAGGALRVLAGIATDFMPQLSRPLVVRVFAVTQALCLIVLFFGSRIPLPIAVATFVIAGVASCAWQGAHFAHIAALAGARQAGTALGLNNAATSLGAFIPQVVAGGLAAAFDWPATIVILGIIPALLAFFVFPKHSLQRTTSMVSSITPA